MLPQLPPVTLHEIVSRRKKSASATAAPTDFILRLSGELPDESSGWPGIPYCADFDAARAWFARCPGAERWLHAPFLWAAQFEQAKQIAMVPFERLEGLISGTSLQPTFFFSISRCGSTLISSLLNASGLATVSEPDLLTQLATEKFEGHRQISREVTSLLIRACLSSLAARWGEHLAVKLRSQCNAIAPEMAALFPRANFVVILRDRVSWAASRYNAFGGEPRKLANMYKRGIQTYHRLWSAGVAPALIWYEDILKEPMTVLRRLLERGVPLAPLHEERIRSVFDTDSQSGSPLARGRLPRRKLTREQIGEFEDEWQRIRPVELIARYSLERIG